MGSVDYWAVPKRGICENCGKEIRVGRGKTWKHMNSRIKCVGDPWDLRVAKLGGA